MVCNTEAVINLENVTITSDGNVLIRATDASSGDDNINSDWGSAGGDITFTATGQTLEGTVSCNELSTISMTLKDSEDGKTASSLTGDVVIEDGGNVNISLEGNSNWTVTGASEVTSLDGVILSGTTATNISGSSSSVVVSCDSAEDDSGSTIANGTYSLTGGGSLEVGS
jgi:hypothetical protein